MEHPQVSNVTRKPYGNLISSDTHTATDVSRYAGTYEHIFEATTAGVVLQSPQLDINTVAAGGGSKLFWSNGLFKAGPESAGAHPGPACYRKGGPLTVTDANLFLGRLVPEFFPHIFGEKENEPLDVAVAREKFKSLCEEVNKGLQKGATPLTSEEVALGFLRVANESMCRPIRTLTEARGYDTAAHDLAVFGGAGGQHACSIASSLGIGRVILHRHSSILSAYGITLADVVSDIQSPLACIFNDKNLPDIQRTAEKLQAKASAELQSQGLDENGRKEFELYLHMHYEGSDTLIMISKPSDGWDFATKFIERHRQEFGFTMPRDVLVGDVRVRATGKSAVSSDMESPEQEMETLQCRTASKEVVETSRDVYFENMGWQLTPVCLLGSLVPGDQIHGPALVIDNTQTILVPPGAKATTLRNHIVIDVSAITLRTKQPTNVVDPVQLSVFGHRFMGIAEQMGRTLQKTSVSTNIKERLDFSCAIFSGEGTLVANGIFFPPPNCCLENAANDS